MQSFLRDDAITYEKSYTSRTFLVYDEENPGDGIRGYFSLSFREWKITPGTADASASAIKKMKGRDSRRSVGSDAEEELTVRGYLLGQLGRCHSEGKSRTNMDQLMGLVFSKLARAQMSVGCRTLILECEDTETLVNHYQRHGFQRLQMGGKLLQMYRIFDAQEILEHEAAELEAGMGATPA